MQEEIPWMNNNKVAGAKILTEENDVETRKDRVVLPRFRFFLQKVPVITNCFEKRVSFPSTADFIFCFQSD